MAQNPDRLIDRTHLSIDQAEERGFIHRDYIAHCFRWSHVVKFLMQRHRYKDAHIIDIGCGKDQPLPRLLYANKMTGFDYTGIDANHMDFHDTLTKAHQNGKMRVSLHDDCDASLLPPEDLAWGLGDIGVCFEVLEHMQPFILRRMLKNWKNLFKADATIFVSTPVFNGSAADNHINEMGRETLGQLFEFHGFTIEGHWGTFASQSDLRNVMSPGDEAVLDRLGDYYDSNVLSTIMAPLYPQGSRNILWQLKNKRPIPEAQKFWDITCELVLDKNQNPDIMQAFHGKDL
jgi:2-polyprenyl-3-methyl-5-hydroxy-6-metoxy-1,4-benzoquinol methylase